MKKLPGFLCLVFTLFCAHADDLLVSDKPYSENGQIRMEKQKDRDEPAKTEYGKINSVSYLIDYANGKAIFGNVPDPAGNWTVSCRKYSAFNDVHCPIRQKGLSVYIYASGENGVSIGPNIYPKSSAAILIDEDRPLSTKRGKKGVFDPETGKNIIRKLNSSSKVRIRYAQWPNKKAFEEVIDMQGYDEAVAYAYWAMKHLREPDAP